MDSQVGARRLRTLGAVLGDVMADTAGHIEELHRGIAGRAFGAVGAGGVPARTVHDAVSAAVYAVVRGGLRAAAGLGGAVAAASPLAGHPRLDGAEASFVEGAVWGLYGDHIAERHPQLSIPMTVRHDGRDVELTTSAMRRAYPDATGDLAVFLHGLCETDLSWGEGGDGGAYGDHLRRSLDITPLSIRYNTGLHVSDNGAHLDDVLDAVVRAWPVRVERIALIGHSMGGLVIRSACDIASGRAAAWVDLVDHCVYLGTPHDGAPLERAVNLLAGTLRALPETRPLASFLDVRSAGIKDLRFGYVREQDWRGHDADAVLLDTGADLPLLAGAAHHCVTATLGATPEHTVSRLLGDLLVLHASASGHGRRGVALAFGEGDRHHLGRLHHFDLLDHPAIADQLRRWLSDGD